MCADPAVVHAWTEATPLPSRASTPLQRKAHPGWTL